MRRTYRGFRGQVAPLTPGLAGLGWFRRDTWDDTYKNDPRYGEALTFCGREDYNAYVAQHGAPPPGSAVYGTGMGMPQMCIDAGYTKEYVYGTGNILQTKITAPGEVTGPAPDPTFEPAPFTTVSEPVAESALPTMPPGTDPDAWAFDLWRTGYTTGPDPRIAQEAEALAARQQELETRQATEAGDGIVPELEARASVQEATRRAIDIGGGPGPGPSAPLPPAPVPDKAPNWLPLIIGAVAIYLMQ